MYRYGTTPGFQDPAGWSLPKDLQLFVLMLVEQNGSTLRNTPRSLASPKVRPEATAATSRHILYASVASIHIRSGIDFY